MATFRTYICRTCGYEVQTEPSGRYALMSGPYTNYVCGHCKEVVAVRDWDVEEADHIACPECGREDEMMLWNPKCTCPKCGGRMAENKRAGIIMAD